MTACTISLENSMWRGHAYWTGTPGLPLSQAFFAVGPWSFGQTPPQALLGSPCLHSSTAN